MAPLVLQKVFDIMSDTKKPVVVYIARALGIIIVPSIFIVTLIALLINQEQAGDLIQLIQNRSLTIESILILVVIVPFIETLCMVPLIKLLSNLLNNEKMIVLFSALIWATLHSLQLPIWGLGVFWSFYIYSISLQAWGKQLMGKAVLVTATTHMMVNVFAVLMAVITPD